MKTRKFKEKIILILLTTTNILAVLYFFNFLNNPSFALSLSLLFILDIILIKQIKNISTISVFLKKQYFKTKFRILNSYDDKGKTKYRLLNLLNKLYLRILFNLILVFKNSESGYQVVREDIFNSRDLLFTKIKASEEDEVADILSIRKK